eukprot:TRINITY_DN2578_c0_g1_i3.p1 TRINITY_DN2578_c0_g1~~TRINITY_DN2578_c0_g1_i3.p1  ORF type:complete len:565 (+),score=89.53 TRINITY_DN2578_c0_g1_i3:541-2235(+)
MRFTILIIETNSTTKCIEDELDLPKVTNALKTFFNKSEPLPDARMMRIASVVHLSMASHFASIGDDVSALGSYEFAAKLLEIFLEEQYPGPDLRLVLATSYRGIARVLERRQGATHLSQYYIEKANFMQNCTTDDAVPTFSAQTLALRSQSPFRSQGQKIVGLFHVRNVEKILKVTLPTFAKVMDSIVILDNNSTDKTLEVITSLKESCKIEKIITHQAGDKLDELKMKQILLDEGRRVKGTHFSLVDADEMFSWSLLQDDLLRTMIQNLRPLEMITTPWVHLWQSVHHFRFEPSFRYDPLSRRQCVGWADHPSLNFCVDEKCIPRIHIARCPQVGEKARLIHLGGLQNVLIHLRFLEDVDSISMKQVWYMMKEKVMNPMKSDKDIIGFYKEKFNVKPQHLQPSPRKWFSGYNMKVSQGLMIAYAEHDIWREKEILQMNRTYGNLVSGLNLGRWIRIANRRVESDIDSKGYIVIPRQLIRDNIHLSTMYSVHSWSFLHKSRTSSLSRLYSILSERLSSSKPSLSTDLRIISRYCEKIITSEKDEDDDTGDDGDENGRREMTAKG